MNYNMIIPVLIFISLVTFAAGVYILAESKAKHRKFLEKIKHGADESLMPGANEMPLSSGSQLKKYFSRVIGRIGKIMKSGENDISRIRLMLLRAGYHGLHAPAFHVGVKILMAVLLPVVVFSLIIASIKVLTPLFVIFAISFAALAGFYLPDFWMKIKTAIRQEKILHGFPDALDLLVVCVEAGMGLDAAMTRVGEEMRLSNRPLSNEFRMMNLELRAGKERKDALRNLALRTGLEEVNSLVTLMIQTDKFGTSIAQALRVHSDFLRTKRYQKAEELAGKLPVKLIFPLILFIFPALFITIMGPAVINIIRAFAPVVSR